MNQRGKTFGESVFLTRRVHPFPFRTRKLSSAVPKILAWRRAGKIGQCRHTTAKPNTCFAVSHIYIQGVSMVEWIKLDGSEHTYDRLNTLTSPYSSLAQSVERMTVNHDVAGSSPAGGAIYVVRKDYYTQKSLIFKDFSCY